MAKTVVRAVVAVKETHRLELAHPVKVATAVRQTLLAVAVVAVQAQRAAMEQEAIPVQAAMVLHPQSAVHQLLMQVVVAAARMAFTTITTILAGRVAVEQVAMAACLLRELPTQAAAAVVTPASTEQTDRAQTVVREL
jgi:hypothetical protein